MFVKRTFRERGTDFEVRLKPVRWLINLLEESNNAHARAHALRASSRPSRRDNRVRCYPLEEREMNGKRYLYYAVEAEAIRGI